MSWTLGAFTTLRNPLNAEAKPRRDVAAYEVWRMADGSVRKHVVGAERWLWEPRFDVGGDDLVSLRAAYYAAFDAVGGVDFVSWDPTDGVTRSVIVRDWEEDPKSTGGGGVRHRVQFTIEERAA